MQTMSTAEIRRAFLEYFAAHEHKIVHSASLVPGNDPTLLFTNAGMVPFKDVFTGLATRAYKRATSAQRCVRAGGKHNDLENVGYTARHHTFFEMMGNFSFGDYFKEKAIPFAWNLLTEVFGIPAEKLLVTVYHEDDEAFSIWRDVIGLPEERILRIGDKPGKAKYDSDNFWMMGDTGPCGPCSEIFYDHGPDVFGGPPGSADEDGDRFIEIWNIVFMQFERDADGNMTPLPKPSIDTGMGLERMAAVMQGVHSNYEIDLFVHLLQAAAEAVGCENDGQASLKVIADHIRATVFLMVDGVLPSNEGRGYVLRRIMRRAMRHGHKLGQSGLFFYKLVRPLVEEMGEAYPEIVEAENRIRDAIRKEEERFSRTLDAGMAILEKELATMEGSVIPGQVVFRLYDTHGFPVDLTNDIARERNLTLDIEGYEAAMAEQQLLAQAGGKFKAGKTLPVEGQTAFRGYHQNVTLSKILQIFKNDQPVEEISEGESGILVLDQTPFYAESGGQVGDIGEISHRLGAFEVEDTQKQGDVFLHYGVMKKGTLSQGENVDAELDRARRAQIRRHHSATHLLHKALKEVLGNHVQQKGSLVDAQKTRFDFAHDAPLTEAQMNQVEQLINEQVLANSVVSVQEMGYEEARRKGATALFGEKYGDVVRVLSMGKNNFSIELCGGTHVARTGDIGLVKIVSDSSVSAGVRRVECVAGMESLRLAQQKQRLLNRLGGLMKSDHEGIPERIEAMQQQLKQSEREIQSLKRELASGGGGESLAPEFIHGWKALVLRRDGFDNETLRNSADQLRDK